MAETKFHCPQCGRAGSTTRTIPPGASARCPGCGEVFKIEADAGPDLPRPVPVPVFAERRVDRSPRAETVESSSPPIEPVLAPLARRPASMKASNGPAQRKRKKKARKAGKIDRDAWVSLGVGSGLAVVALAVPLLGFVSHVLMTVIHELGHTATAWLFASPALPSFDLSHGGGVSLILARQPILVIVAYLILAFFLFRARADRPKLIGWAVVAALYSVAIFSPLRSLLITAMGQGSELLFAGIFLHRALSGNQILRNEERPLYAFLGMFILLYDARFAVDLMSSHAQREAYGDAKGGGQWMDFDLIANESLHWSLQSVACLFLFACALTPVAAFLVHRYGNRPR